VSLGRPAESSADRPSPCRVVAQAAQRYASDRQRGRTRARGCRQLQ